MVLGKRKNVNEETVKTSAFSKEQIISSKRYEGRKDLVQILLKNNQRYNFDEVDSLINEFMKGKVK
ncbi:MAG: hypothetical protein ACYDG2_19475 [Ruminiclostridium sp.]